MEHNFLKEYFNVWVSSQKYQLMKSTVILQISAINPCVICKKFCIILHGFVFCPEIVVFVFSFLSLLWLEVAKILHYFA
jgi:hypothetical protein